MNIGAILPRKTEVVLKGTQEQEQNTQVFGNTLNDAVKTSNKKDNGLLVNNGGNSKQHVVNEDGSGNEKLLSEESSNQVDITNDLIGVFGLELTNDNNVTDTQICSSLITTEVAENKESNNDTSIQDKFTSLQLMTLLSTDSPILTTSSILNLENEIELSGINNLNQVNETELTGINNMNLVNEAEVEGEVKKFEVLWNQVKAILGQIENDSITKETEVKILKLLEQWTTVEKSSTTQPFIEQLYGKDSSKEQAMWTKLLQTYQKRIDLQLQQKYQTSSTVTTADVSKWVKNALANYASDITDTKQVNTGDVQPSSIPISKIEQFVVHLNQSTSNDQEALQKQLVEEFQKVIKSSKFMSNNNGSSQLLLKLRPENLGDVMVKLTQLNGEMIVKITTTTQAAKDALEGNMQQLRHMFSPQQVVVEKQDLSSFQQGQEELNQQTDHHTSDQSNREDTQEHSDGQQASEVEHEVSFHQLLMNEKV